MKGRALWAPSPITAEFVIQHPPFTTSRFIAPRAFFVVVRTKQIFGALKPTSIAAGEPTR